MNEEIQSPPMPDQQENAWIRAFLSGSVEAFDKLVLRYKDRVFNLCYRTLGDYDEANDCAQETFVKVYRSLKDFRFEAKFSTWLHAVAANTCRNRLKSLEYRYRSKRVRIDPTGEKDAGNSPMELADPAPSALTELARQEQDVALQKAIDTLTRDHKVVVILRDVEGLSYEAIADITGYSLGTVKSKLARARRRLSELLKGVI
jgi:RNA polymerase sigma-70 factor, ECF subfamily